MEFKDRRRFEEVINHMCTHYQAIMTEHKMHNYFDALCNFSLDTIERQIRWWMENRTYMPDFDVLKKFIESRTEKQEPILARQVVLENELIKLEDEFTQFMKGRMGKTLEDYCANLHVREQIENRMSDVRRKLRSAGYSEADIRQIWEKESFKRKNRHPASPVTEARIKYVQDFIKRAAIRV